MNPARPRRLLMTCDTVGGVWTFALELAEALADYDIEVLLACLGGAASASQRAEAARVPNLELANSAYKLEWMPEPWLDIALSGDWLRRLADRFQPDLVHLNSFGHAALPWSVPFVLTAHSCVLSWWAAVRGEPAPAEWNRYRDLVEGALSSASLVTAPSQAMRAALARHYQFVDRNVIVIPNGRRADRFQPKPKDPIVLTAGRLWDDAKNAAAVDRIAPRLPWRCYLAGRRRHPDGTEAVAKGCIPLGALPAAEMADWYARAAIYALPARYEPFGLSALEAALSGCALVLGDIDSLREIWADTAIFVTPDEDRQLGEALAALIDDPPRRIAMAASSRQRAQRFNQRAMGAAYFETYCRAVGERSVACAS